MAAGAIAGRISAPRGLDSDTVHALIDAARREDREQVAAWMMHLRRDQELRYLSLRRDLETVAAMTDRELQQARLGLVRLAANLHPDAAGEPSFP